MSFVESHLLTLVIFLPVLGAVLIALLPAARAGSTRASPSSSACSRS